MSLLNKFKLKLIAFNSRIKSKFNKPQKQEQPEKQPTKVPIEETQYNTPTNSINNTEYVSINYESGDQSQFIESNTTLKPAIESPSPTMVNVNEWVSNVAVKCVVEYPELDYYMTNQEFIVPTRFGINDQNMVNHDTKLVVTDQKITHVTLERKKTRKSKSKDVDDVLLTVKTLERK